MSIISFVFGRVWILKSLEAKIVSEGQVFEGDILKVGSFLNQQIDTVFMMEMGREIANLYKNENVTKVLTVEASGIALALAAGYSLGVPAVFAKKNKTANVQSDVYSAVVYSFTHRREYNIVVSNEYIGPDDTVLIVDDFLAEGNALRGLISIVNQSGARLAGCSVAVEKGFQSGGDKLRSEGVRVDSLAIIEKMSPTEIIFR